MAESIFTACAAARLAKSDTVAIATNKRFMDDSSNRMRPFPVEAIGPRETAGYATVNGRLNRLPRGVFRPSEDELRLEPELVVLGAPAAVGRVVLELAVVRLHLHDVLVVVVVERDAALV